MTHPLHPLHGYLAARANRHRYLVIRNDGGKKTYFAGMCGFVEERDQATRFQSRPNDILQRLPDADTELA